MKKNLFIAFEGIDGSGKSTQVKLLSEYLEEKGYKIYTTCEPTDSPIGKIIRDIFNHRLEGDQRVIAALFAADRLDHILNSKTGILKKLQDGYTVITDRYYFSSYAYHSVYVDMDWVIHTNSMSADLLRPDLNIYIDISPEISMERLKKGRSSMEMYETLENQKKVHTKYREAFDRIGEVEKVVVVDGNKSPDQISAQIIKKITFDL